MEVKSHLVGISGDHPETEDSDREAQVPSAAGGRDREDQEQSRDSDGEWRSVDRQRRQIKDAETGTQSNKYNNRGESEKERINKETNLFGNLRGTSFRENKKLVYFNYNEEGHFKRNCDKTKIIDCFRCGELGHRAADCLSIRGGKNVNPQSGSDASNSGRIERSYARVVGGDRERTDNLTVTDTEGGNKPGLEVGKVGSARNSLEVTLELEKVKFGKIDQRMGKKYRGYSVDTMRML